MARNIRHPVDTLRALAALYEPIHRIGLLAQLPPAPDTAEEQRWEELMQINDGMEDTLVEFMYCLWGARGDVEAWIEQYAPPRPAMPLGADACLRPSMRALLLPLARRIVALNGTTVRMANEIHQIAEDAATTAVAAQGENDSHYVSGIAGAFSALASIASGDPSGHALDREAAEICLRNLAHVAMDVFGETEGERAA